MTYEEMKKSLDDAEKRRNKDAMFHYLTLRHAKDLIDENPEDFCKAVGMKKTYSIEFRKMRALYSLMKNKNLSL